MKIKHLALIIITALLVQNLTAQELKYKSYEWGKTDSFELNEELDKEILLRKEIIQYTHEKDYFVEYSMLNQIEYINSDDEIERSNRKYISFNYGDEVIVHKARVIKPDGTVVLLDDSKYIEATDEQTGENLKYFAFEGIEKGSVIDYMYVLRKAPDYNGVKKYFQYDNILVNFNFELYCPPHLIFDFKVYNDTNTVKFDTTLTEIHRWELNISNIDKLVEEEMAPYHPLRKSLVYKLDKNLGNNTNDITSYGQASQNVYSNIYGIEKDELKAVNKVISKAGIKSSMSNEEKIRAIENYVKRNIQVVEYRAPELTNLASIYKNKFASEYGSARLFANLFKQAGVKHELVLTCDRNYNYFDKDFESYHYLSDYLIYFPDTKKYMFPYDISYRYGIVPPELTDNYGLFIKELKLGGMETGMGKVKYIDPLPYEITQRNMDVLTSIDLNTLTTNIKLVNEQHGYSALYMHYAFELLDQEKKDELALENFRGLLENIELDNWEVENANADLFGVEPLILSCNGTIENMAEKAGNKILFKFGELIGPQMEMYNDEERQLPIHSFYKRMYHHNLKFEIPDGYIIKNADDLKIQEIYAEDGKTIMQFVADYSIEDNMLTVKIKEFYDQISFPVEEIQNYRRIVNAAADFNKVVLVLEKK